MTGSRIVLAVCLFMFLIWGTSFAGTISIQTTTNTKMVEGKPVLEVTVRNSGDEAAANVRVIAELLDQKVSSTTWPQIAAGGHETTSISFEKLPEKQGRYPVVILTEFADLNMYPFSAVTIASLEAGAQSTTQIMAKIEGKKSGKYLDLTLKNLDSFRKQISLKIVAAKELNVEPAQLKIELSPYEIKTFRINVSNFSALPGATYPIYAVIEYEDDVRHSSLVAVTPYRVMSGTKEVGTKTILIIVAAALIGAFAALQIFSLVNKRRKHSSTR